MKLKLLVLALINFNLYSQTAPTGFYEIPFGSAYEKAYQIISKKPGCKVSRLDRPFVIIVDNCRFGGFNSDFGSLSFIDGKFSSGSMVLKPKSRSSDQKENNNFLYASFLEVESNLILKYGEPKVKNIPIKSPVPGILEIGYESIWYFPKGCYNCSKRIKLTAQNGSDNFFLEYIDIDAERRRKSFEKKDY